MRDDAPDEPVPFPPVDLERIRRRNQKVGHWHDEWTELYRNRAEFYPEGRPEGSDYSMHHVDVDSPEGAERHFDRISREIERRPKAGMGAYKLPWPTPHERVLGAMVVGLVGDSLGRDISAGDVVLPRRKPLSETRSLNWETLGRIDPQLGGRSGSGSATSKASLFVLEGLIRAHVSRRYEPRDNDPIPELQHALQRWLHSQGDPWAHAAGPYGQYREQPDGWLVTNHELFIDYSSDEISMAAARNFAATGIRTGTEYRINEAQGPGALMRSAPMAVWSNDPAEVFDSAVRMAALTHGHPTGYLPAGVLAVIFHQLLRDANVSDAIQSGRNKLVNYQGHEDTEALLKKAVEHGERDGYPLSSKSVQNAFGFGDTAAEALAIGVYAVLESDYIREAVLLGINHDGNSAATGYVSGVLAGALFASHAIPDDLVDPLDLYELTQILTQDALTEFSPDPPVDPSWVQRYPAW